LKEEENNQLDDLSTIDELNDENNDIEMNENVIKALVEQARNEGIVPFQNEGLVESGLLVLFIV
jgi:hypothetical protein